jgi:hypothetical protein
MRKLACVLAVLMIVVGLLVGCNSKDTTMPSSPAADLEANDAAAKAGCSGSSCEGYDPNSKGCGSDAYTVASKYLYSGSTQVGLVELRYSPSCNANWARVSRYQGSVSYPLKAEAVGNPSGYQATQLSGSYSVYSNMIDGNKSVAACGMVCMNNGSPSCTSGYGCTGYY